MTDKTENESGMFDKLGDLLNSVLESGFLPSSEETLKEAAETQAASFLPETENSKPEIKLPQEVKNAFKKCGMQETTDFTLAKQEYRQKLMYYHPDRRNDNPVLQKVAREKTQELLLNWKFIESFFQQL